ncbi:MAG: endonuclease MutS2, partial [candidate division NC10 bacterium]|nr:endonuclease MutS2 [candidate division NC10 bacterium]
MDAHSLKVLEFEAIKAWLASHACTPLGAERVGALNPSSNREEVEAWLDECSEFREILAKGEVAPFQGITDIRDSLVRSRIEGFVLSSHELLQIANTLEASRRLRVFFRQQKASCPRLCRPFGHLKPCEELIGEIRTAVLEDGSIADEASGKLRALREEIRRLREEVYARLQSLLQDPAHQWVIAEPLITMRNERYVIPVRPNFRSSLRGLVQDQSGSGQTVFLEPAAVVELNNRLRQLRSTEEEEIRRILMRLTKAAGRRAEEIGETVEALGEIDFIHARALLAEELKCSRPKLNEDQRLILIQARHPLLVKRSAVSGQRSANRQETGDRRPETGDLPVVPIDVRLGEAFQILVITGPNTGGKTVALKTMGLLTLMALAGLHIPASADSEIPLYTGVFADIGDEQSIEQSLSTFSSHLTQIVRILGQADSRSLVLLDELGAGTDPAEGAALGIAILEELLRLGTSTVATTHLEAIKAFAYTKPHVENAFVEFDLDSLRPLYKLSIGLPGKSYALEVASYLGISPGIIEQARRHLGERGLHLRALIERLERDQREAEAKRVFWEREAAEAAVLKARHEELLQALEDEAKGRRRQALHEALTIVAQARKEVDRLLEGIRSSASLGAAQEGRRDLERLQKAMAEERALLQATEGPPGEVLRSEE